MVKNIVALRISYEYCISKHKRVLTDSYSLNCSFSEMLNNGAKIQK